MDNLPVIVIRFALYADLMVLAGIVAFSLYALTANERNSGILPLSMPCLILASAGFAVSGLGMLALTASMTGSSIWSVDGEVLREIIGETAIGTAWIVRMAALAVAVLSAFAINRSAKALYAILASTSLAIATLVWTGHAGSTEGWIGTVHRSSDIVHMLAVAVWLGGIAAFGRILFRPVTALSGAQIAVAHRALGRQAARVAQATGLATGRRSGAFSADPVRAGPRDRLAPAHDTRRDGVRRRAVCSAVAGCGHVPVVCRRHATAPGGRVAGRAGGRSVGCGCSDARPHHDGRGTVDRNSGAPILRV